MKWYVIQDGEFSYITKRERMPDQYHLGPFSTWGEAKLELIKWASEKRDFWSFCTRQFRRMKIDDLYPELASDKET